jgi:hypothetical protein
MPDKHWEHDSTSQSHHETDMGHESHESMGQRGVTRPQMSGKDGHDNMKMSPEDLLKMLHRHHQQTLWVYWLLIILGVWMVLAPLTFDHGKATVQPSGGREVWLSLAARITAMTWSDIVSGLLLLISAGDR